MSSDDFNLPKKVELRTISVDDIAEFPTELGSKCLLLRELGLNAYCNTEEELLSVLTESALRSEHLDICLRYSRCQAFWNMFQKGITHFNERDPIQLDEYEGRNWVVEGKHRVCLAKRAGVKSLQAYVWHLPEDLESLMPNKGNPGCYKFQYVYARGKRTEAQGEIAILWVKNPTGIIMPNRLGFYPVLMDMGQDTKGEFVSLFPGFGYRVSVASTTKRLGIFHRHEFFSVETEVVLEAGHKKAKVWLLTAPAREAFSLRPAGLLPLKTIYRFGCWRKHHAKLLSSICFGLGKNNFLA